VNVNNDLSIPKYQLSPATVFPGNDGVLGTSDDVRPFNNFLQQQTNLNKYGMPVWLTPDVVPDQSKTGSSATGNSVSITVGILNQGSAAIGSPVFVTLYGDSVSTATRIRFDSINVQINPGRTKLVTVSIPDISIYPDFVNLVIRINDRNGVFPYQDECRTDGSTVTVRNPTLNVSMMIDASFDGFVSIENGTFPNPASVLYSEQIEYRITAVNVSTQTGTVVVRDTLPPYLNYVTGSISQGGVVNTSSGIVPDRAVLTWTLDNVNPFDTKTVTFKATPAEGICASQPLFINSAWITPVNSASVTTDNRTYHQGAGVSIVAFSTGWGGSIFNAAPQAVDYHTSARRGIIIAPEDGYRFNGWSHGEYVSLKGETVKAKRGIMHYDTLTVYGNVELKANFELIEYPIRYFTNESVNPPSNPVKYTIETDITLEAPEKAGDMFTGWTGSNGDEPQLAVNIPKGSTGELTFYANFLVSGRETEEITVMEDKIWSSGNTLYIKTSTPESAIRIYSTDGILQKRHNAASPDTAKIQLPGGIYVITLNNGLGRKVRIN
jgi:uncharacterized repeat protein (TIGR02543 family)/uncharacterized repeat protein (TIGR01451 family)